MLPKLHLEAVWVYLSRSDTPFIISDAVSFAITPEELIIYGLDLRTFHFNWSAVTHFITRETYEPVVTEVTGDDH